jgi:single-strand DNA-binding protein
MASFSRVILVGNMTRTPELRHIPSGLAVTDFGIAINDRRKLGSGEWVEEVTFVDVTLWGRQAEVACEYAGKGTSVLVEGRLKQDSWESEGQKRSKLKVIGDRLVLLGSASGNRGGGGGGDDEGGGSYAPRQSGARNAPRSTSQSQQQDYYDVSTDGEDVPF